MCDVPSWIEDEKGICHWLTDAAIEAAIEGGLIDNQTQKPMTWADAVGHHAIEQISGVFGTHQGGRIGLPEKFKADIRKGKCSKMIIAGKDSAAINIPDLVPAGLRKKLGIKTIEKNGKYEIAEGVWIIIGDCAVEIKQTGGAVWGDGNSQITSSGQTGGAVRGDGNSQIKKVDAK